MTAISGVESRRIDDNAPFQFLPIGHTIPQVAAFCSRLGRRHSPVSPNANFFSNFWCHFIQPIGPQKKSINPNFPLNIENDGGEEHPVA